jgi:acyl-CoA thioesterase superfamily protein/acyl-Coa thioesterase superfamily protein
MDEPVFHSDGTGFVATAHARGPWDPQALHGGAPAALLARAVERFEPAGLRVARLSYEFLRPVPLGRLELAIELQRPGRRVQLVGASLHAGGVEVCRVTALRMAPSPAQLGSISTVRSAGWREADALTTTPFRLGQAGGASFASSGVEMRFARGGVEAGPAAVWLRLRRPVVDDEPPSPLMRVAAAADFGNGVSWELDFRRFVFINPDLVIALWREPVGEWVLLDATTRADPGAGATAFSGLHDVDGQLGVAAQSLLVAERDEQPQARGAPRS